VLVNNGTMGTRTDNQAVSVRMVLDSFLWSPFVCCRESLSNFTGRHGKTDLVVFPTCIGTMEGKPLKQIKQKIDTVGSPSLIEVNEADGQFAFTTWVRAQCVFGPTQLMNYTFVPLHLRLLVLQTAGFCESSSGSMTLAHKKAGIYTSHGPTSQVIDTSRTVFIRPLIKSGRRSVGSSRQFIQLSGGA
jgi:hypothetical protein